MQFCQLKTNRHCCRGFSAQNKCLSNGGGGGGGRGDMLAGIDGLRS